MKKINIFYYIFIFFISFSIYSNNKIKIKNIEVFKFKHDTTLSFISKSLIGKYEMSYDLIDEYGNALKILFPYKKSRILKNITLREMLFRYSQKMILQNKFGHEMKKVEMPTPEKIDKKIYMYVFKKLVCNLDFDDAEDFVHLNNVDNDFIYNFFYDAVLIDNFHQKYVTADILSAKQEIYNYFRYGNTVKEKTRYLNYDIFRIKIYKHKNKKVNFTRTLKILFDLKKNDIYNVSTYFIDNKIDSQIKRLYINYPYLVFKKFKKYFKYNVSSTTIGPIYADKEILFLKIIKQKIRIPEKHHYIKVIHYFIKKKHDSHDVYTYTYDKTNSRTEAFFKLNNVIAKFTKFNNDSFASHYANIEYINLETYNDIYYEVKHLEKNQFSKIFELVDGWHLFRVLKKEYHPKSKAYEKIKTKVIAHKGKHLQKEYVYDCANDIYTYIY